MYNSLIHGGTAPFDTVVETAAQECALACEGQSAALRYHKEHGLLERDAEEAAREIVQSSLAVMEFYCVRADELLEKLHDGGAGVDVVRHVYQKLKVLTAKPPVVSLAGKTITEALPAAVAALQKKWDAEGALLEQAVHEANMVYTERMRATLHAAAMQKRADALEEIAAEEARQSARRDDANATLARLGFFKFKEKEAQRAILQEAEEALRRAAEAKAAAEQSYERETHLIERQLQSMRSGISNRAEAEFPMPTEPNHRLAVAEATASCEKAARELFETYRAQEREKRYGDALALMKAKNYEEAAAEFRQLRDFRESEEKLKVCEAAILDAKQAHAAKLLEGGKYDKAREVLEQLDGHGGSMERIRLAVEALASSGKKAQAAILFALINTEEAAARSAALWDEVADRASIALGGEHVAGLKTDGTVVVAGSCNPSSKRCKVGNWKGIVAVAAGQNCTVGLKKDGTVVAAGENRRGECNVSDWRNIVAIAVGRYHTVGLKADGTVVATNVNRNGECDVSAWRDITAISAARGYTVGLRANGTVVITESANAPKVTAWKNIVALAADEKQVVGLKADGHVVVAKCAGPGSRKKSVMTEWEDIVAITPYSGLKSDGTVVTSDKKAFNRTDIVAIEENEKSLVGLKADGSLVVVGENQRRIADWRDIRIPPRAHRQ